MAMPLERTASVEDMVIQCCRRERGLIAAPARKIANPVVDRRSDQLESASTNSLLALGE